MKRLLIATALCLTVAPAATAHDPATPWLGVHIMVSAPRHDNVPLLQRAIAERLAPLGVNALILEVNYNFQYRSHPELAASGGMTATPRPGRGLPRPGNPADPDVQLPRPPVLGQGDVPPAGQAPGVRRDPRRPIGQPRHLLQSGAPWSPASTGSSST